MVHGTLAEMFHVMAENVDNPESASNAGVRTINMEYGRGNNIQVTVWSRLPHL